MTGVQTCALPIWQGDTGDVRIINNNTNQSAVFFTTYGIFNNLGYWGSNHMITSGTAYDPWSCNTIPVVCPGGGQYSFRLGNSESWCHAQDMYYSYRVDPLNPILIYAFAPVLQDPYHADSIQPAFLCYAKDSIGNIIPCTYYRVTASNLRGAIQCPSPGGSVAVSRTWKNVAVDMSAYANRTITLYFQTSDCGYCAHFGYAYIDVIGCYPKNIEIPRCNLNGSTLTAPPGMSSYLWSTGQNTQSIIIGYGSGIIRSVTDRKSTRLNSSHIPLSRMPSSA